jgi:hypothetical protein
VALTPENPIRSGLQASKHIFFKFYVKKELHRPLRGLYVNEFLDKYKNPVY